MAEDSLNEILRTKEYERQDRVGDLYIAAKTLVAEYLLQGKGCVLTNHRDYGASVNIDKRSFEIEYRSVPDPYLNLYVHKKGILGGLNWHHVLEVYYYASADYPFYIMIYSPGNWEKPLIEEGKKVRAEDKIWKRKKN